MSRTAFDVVVVGGGNAALCAALSARENGAEVALVEKAPRTERGGNSYFTGGLMRFPHHGTEDVASLFPELALTSGDDFTLAPYDESAFLDDIGAMTEYQSDPELADRVVSHARETLQWMHEHGVRFVWSLGRHAFKVDGRFQFWGGAPIEVRGGGAGLVDSLYVAAEAAGVEILYGTSATELLGPWGGPVEGVRALQVRGDVIDLEGAAVVLACGGFEANAQMRAQFLGRNWDLAKVRGTRFNTGDGITMATAKGAQPYGHWSGCHAVAWDANAPRTGDRSMGDEFSRHSYPLGVVVNRGCERFLDEGEDFQTHTYAKYGAEILRQPGLVAYQIFDAKVEPYLRGDYRGKRTSKVVAQSLRDLAAGLELDPEALQRTIEEFNAAVQPGTFDPNVKDGKATQGVLPPKSNWAMPIDTPPYLGFPVSVGITFTFGGLRVDDAGHVHDGRDEPIGGLFAAGEIVGGLFYHNYPSGSGLTAGAVLGRFAGREAAIHAARTADVAVTG